MGEALRLLIGRRSQHCTTRGLRHAVPCCCRCSCPTSRYVRRAEMADARPARLRRHRVRRAHAVARGAARAPSWPQLRASTKDSVTLVVAVFGTTISPYLFFWQASQEVEEIRADARRRAAARRARAGARRSCSASGWTPGRHGLLQPGRLLHHADHRRRRCTRTASPTSRRRRRRPRRCGRWPASSPSLLFALGIIGTGLLAVPVLAGSAAYAVGRELRLDVAAWI